MKTFIGAIALIISEGSGTASTLAGPAVRRALPDPAEPKRL